MDINQNEICKCKQIKDINNIIKRITNIGEYIKKTNNSYHATGSITSLLFYFELEVNCDGDVFKGTAYGFGTPGAGALFGDIYTNDINKLYSETESFNFVATNVYTTIIFHSRNNEVLGTLQTGAVSTVDGTGGGKGTWN